MKVLKEVKTVQMTVDSIFCNCCGKEIEKNQFGYHHEYLSIKKDWGYNSEFDGQSHEIELCQECYKNIIESFKIRPY